MWVCLLCMYVVWYVCYWFDLLCVVYECGYVVISMVV